MNWIALVLAAAAVIVAWYGGFTYGHRYFHRHDAADRNRQYTLGLLYAITRAHGGRILVPDSDMEQIPRFGGVKTLHSDSATVLTSHEDIRDAI